MNPARLVATLHALERPPNFDQVTWHSELTPAFSQGRPSTSAKLRLPHCAATGGGSEVLRVFCYWNGVRCLICFPLPFLAIILCSSFLSQKQKMSSDSPTWRTKSVAMFAQIELVGSWSSTMGHTQVMKVVTTKFNQHVTTGHILLCFVLRLEGCHLFCLN